ncbi:hypothetical protein EIN_207370 [Entamoeba invadens IP1]|uniref:Uncharacterized protein n=1 Tax=Entamoeba invadens IP1 TaxID=370355 RepID=A0A0A1UD53_ENTIV|nr:hypothetical protein EIN_207370 [Entamoeba invadens IP1]ELP91680.1 hypothetical protein EIN_207370 [Entamoeba invadens IP1]|eukprot:XP_004258451.1 hypothetical protein EIN_207370 [Entamoeba invadens IP1]
MSEKIDEPERVDTPFTEAIKTQKDTEALIAQLKSTITQLERVEQLEKSLGIFSDTDVDKSESSENEPALRITFVNSFTNSDESEKSAESQVSTQKSAETNLKVTNSFRKRPHGNEDFEARRDCKND